MVEWGEEDQMNDTEDIIKSIRASLHDSINRTKWNHVLKDMQKSTMTLNTSILNPPWYQIFTLVNRSIWELRQHVSTNLTR